MSLKYSDNLYLLAVVDIIDRYDIILLEVRHLQKIIIDSLHAPTLFLPLRREEKYIFGGWVENKKYRRLLKDEKDFAKVASLCIDRYPVPEFAVEHISKLSQQELKNQDIDMKEKLLRYIGHLWAGDLWVGGERRHYHALRALQILKQQIIRDKLIFLSEAQDADIVPFKKKRGKRCKASLMILRRGILKRMNSYIRIFRTHQQQFGKSLDFGLQSYPRPGIERRRDIGIYNDFLSKRTHDLHKDMQHFLKFFLDTKAKEELKRQGKPIVLHGWSQSPRVSGSQLYDDVGLDLLDDADEHSIDDIPSPQHVSYVDTSFWSPDRPDLQPLVAKYVAESLARNYLGRINDKYLSNHVDDFSNLLTKLNNVVSEFVVNTPELAPRKKHYRRLINKHLSIDFLAATVKGIAYLYAEFLAILGDGLENQLYTTDGYVRLDMLNDLKDGVSSYEDHFVWYFRLRIIAFWLEKIIHTHCSTLDMIVLKGTRQICDDILDFLDTNIPNISSAENEPQVMGALWKTLAGRIERCIAGDSFVSTAKQWRKNRSDDTWCEKLSKSGEKRYHRSSIRLDLRLQCFMFEGTLAHKWKSDNKPIKNNRKLNLMGSDLENQRLKHELYTAFYDVYGLKVEKNVEPANHKNHYQYPRWLYRHLHQIPFQCAILRSIDLLGSPPQQKAPVPAFFQWSSKQVSEDRQPSRHQPKHKWRSFIKEIHADMSLGREKFAMGLEFYTWARESPRDRLSLSNNLIVFILPQLDDDLAVKEQLVVWLRGDEKSVGNNPRAVRNQAANLSNKHLKKFYSDILDDDVMDDIGAESVNRAFSLIEHGSCRETRRLEQLAGYKLKSLFSIYEKYVVKPYMEDKKKYASLNVLLALGAFIKIRGTKEKSDFYDLVLQGFSNAPAKSLLPERIPPVMLSRAVMTNYYAVADPFSNLDKNNQGGADNSRYTYNTATLKYGLTLDKWTCPHKPIKSEVEQAGQFSTILGRYDVVGFIPARIPCKCNIPSFKCDIGENETFVNHFTRREIALPVNIHKTHASDATTLLGIISISLQRRAMRLNLLYRIMSAIDSKKNKEPLPMVEKTIKEMTEKYAGALSIQGYITDGWGDFLLVFNTIDGEKIDKEGLVNDIFILQQMLYEDFMVDRTELIYTPKCIDYIARAKGYDFSISVRMLEDRKLEASVEDFINAFESNQDALRKLVPEIEFGTICQTPGRTDLTMKFKMAEGGRPEGLYNNILQWMAQMDMRKGTWYPDSMSMLGKIETTIERKSSTAH